ncbi:MAG: acetyl-CoA carboxylase biotin carboxylase subunit [Ectothiorhodospiraceae bacterium]|nr:acetyl-CoA carboxylase biotin carboxylase subunit [Ectothiorhodospiraceae bacterium]
MFKKILIANRGEIALRIIRTCREMGISTVAVYSTADENSLHVRFADEAVCIGPPSPKDSYLNIPAIMAAAEITGAEAIHPGYGFLSENANFSEICTDSGYVFIGPSPEMINQMGNKSRAKTTMKAAGVPVVPGSEGVVHSLDDGRAIVEAIGFPVIVKASAGGGGRGMRIIKEASEFERQFSTAKNEAEAAFGNGDLYIERYVENPRHVEIQVLGDKSGNVIHLGERDCSIQRRYQKLMEESPSPAVDADLRRRFGDAAIAGAKGIGYEGAGTIEFLLDSRGEFYFMEMNTRIQVEHPVSEQVCNVDIVREQIRVAAGEKVRETSYEPQGFAMECRINAEDPYKNFQPSPGRIESWHHPSGYGVRVDTHAYQGYVIPPYYDSMIAKLIVTGKTREEVLDRMYHALDEFVIEGVKTTIPLHKELMRNEQVRNGTFDTHFLDGYLKSKLT